MLTALTQGGWGIQNYGKHADIILERSLILERRAYSSIGNKIFAPPLDNEKQLNGEEANIIDVLL